MKSIAKFVSFGIVGCVMLFAGLSATALAAVNEVKVLVLPFQINAGSQFDAAGSDLPSLFRQRLEAKGFEVVSAAETSRLLRQSNVRQLDVETARRLAGQARAGYALYGSVNGNINNYSIDTRLVPAAGTGPARPYFIQKNALIELLPAVQELVDRVSIDAVSSNAVADIQVRGLNYLDEDVVLMRLNIGKGDVATPDAINEEIKRIWDLGYFSDVTAEIERSGHGQVLVFTLEEKPRISGVVVNGSDAVSKDDILAAMSSKTGSVLNERLLAQDVQTVTELYRKEGYYLADVQARVEQPQGSMTAALVFDVSEGEKLYIKDVIIEGLEAIDEDDIKKDLALTERGLLSWFTGTGVLREEYLERDSAVLQAFCLDNGFIDAQISAPEVIYEKDGIIIKYQINEGARYKLGTIEFVGDMIDTEERMNEIITLDNYKEDDEYFKLSIMQDDVKALTDFYGNYGYAFAAIDVQTNKNTEGAEPVLDIRFAFDKKQKVYIRRVETEGNYRTRDNVILREMRMGDGDLFDGAKLRRSNERLHRLRFFTEVDTELVPTGNEDEVDLKVKVAEDKTGAVMGGVGYSTFYKVGVSANITERNLFGRGYSLSLAGFFSSVSTNFDMTFINPRLYDTDLGFGNETYAVWSDWDDFSRKTYGNTIRFFYPLGEYTSIGFGYRLDQYTLYDIPETAPRSYTEYEGENWSSVIHGNLTYDSTDSREQPTRGYVGKLSFEYGGGGLGGNDDFFKPLAELQGFHMVNRNANHVMHWRARVGGVFENSNKPVPVFDRFFIGGMDSIRGYDSSDLAPRDPVYGDEIGGDRMGFLNLEYIWTFEPELGLAIVPFFDIGFQTDSDQTSDPFSELKKSVGLELRWRSPMGDLRFAYGYPLDKSVTGEDLGGRFEFSMGQTF